MLNGSKQIEHENAALAALEPIEEMCDRWDEASRGRWRPIIADLPVKPIADFRMFTHKLAMIAGLSYDHKLAHAAYEYIDSLYQMPGLRKDEVVGRRAILRSCFYLHPVHHPDYCGANDDYICEPLLAGAAMLDAATTGHAAENDWQRYLVDQARNWIDGWAKDPLNKLEDMCNMVAKIAGGDSSFCRRRIAGQKYLERLLCLVWLGPEEREAVVPALATFQAWRDCDY